MRDDSFSLCVHSSHTEIGKWDGSSSITSTMALVFCDGFNILSFTNSLKSVRVEYLQGHTGEGKQNVSQLAVYTSVFIRKTKRFGSG